jgi:hypothetical protein
LLDGGTVFYRFLRAEVRTVPGAATLFASLSREEHLACGLSLVYRARCRRIWVGSQVRAAYDLN